MSEEGAVLRRDAITGEGMGNAGIEFCRRGEIRVSLGCATKAAGGNASAIADASVRDDDVESDEQSAGVKRIPGRRDVVDVVTLPDEAADHQCLGLRLRAGGGRGEARREKCGGKGSRELHATPANERSVIHATPR